MEELELILKGYAFLNTKDTKVTKENAAPLHPPFAYLVTFVFRLFSATEDA